MINWWRTNFGHKEIISLTNSVQNKNISQGKKTEELENKIAEILRVPYVVPCNSGSSSLLMSLMALNIKKGDEVIIPNRTWIATAHAILLSGAKPIIIDVEADTPLMNLKKMAKKINKKTKAIMPVHLNGRYLDIGQINEIIDSKPIKIIEDACQAFLSKNEKKYIGTEGDIGCFSLGMTKLISSGQGGFAVTKDKTLYKKLKLIRNHGVVDQFTDNWNSVGFNFKYTDLQASVALTQLNRYKKIISNVRNIYSLYLKSIKNNGLIKIVPVSIEKGNLPLYVELLCKERSQLTEYLAKRNIQVRPVPPSINSSSYIESNPNLVNSVRFAMQGLYLPCGPDQNIKDVKYVIKILNSFIN